MPVLYRIFLLINLIIFDGFVRKTTTSKTMGKRSILYSLILILIACKNSDSLKEKVIVRDGKEYLLLDSVLISTDDGASIAAMAVRSLSKESRLPSILFHTIYARPERDLENAIQAADEGFVGVVTYSRGKGWSPDSIIPYEYEADDTYSVIEWISKQDWSDGRVGMYGGSYVGFTQWAATKKLHPALKTIVPSVSVAPGIAEPMENGVIPNFFFPWPHYVTSNRYLDTTLYNDNERWVNLYHSWYKHGIAFRNLDSLDGLSNPTFRKWLDHPVYNEYWKKMIPGPKEFSQINIPVLTTTGYYDGGQVGALHYLKEHNRYNQNAEHYLVIGPYTHFGAQRIPDPNVGGYEIDSVARINVTHLIFDWFRYIFKNGEKPEILKDKINFQVMGANKWKHVADLGQMANDTLKFYLSATPSDAPGSFIAGNNGRHDHYSLTGTAPEKTEYLIQKIDFSDRSDSAQNNYFTPFTISDTLMVGNGLSFVSEVFDEAFEINGAYSGDLIVNINKKDFDFSVVLYELTQAGEYFKLTLRNIGRASLMADPSRRTLLEPGSVVRIPLRQVRLTSKMINKGSRLVLVLNGNKHPFEQINYGTGKDVSAESIHDAGDPLVIKWYLGSHFQIPIFH